MKFISELLAITPRLEPMPTGMSPRINRNLTRVRSVIFDVYGTMIISASGDIDKLDFSAERLLNAAAICGLPLPKENRLYRRLIKGYHREIAIAQQRRRDEGCRWPEVDILAVWAEVFRQDAPELSLSGAVLRDVAMCFELCTNPCAPMPELTPTLTGLRNAGLPLGIVSNAQFYTPILMHYFCTGKLFSRRKNIAGFEPSLCIYSYEEKRAKPAPELFDKLRRNLHHYGLTPEETLFVGNDMVKDMLPATAAGMQTALFAGDARSLRLYQDKAETQGYQPNHIITSLNQLGEIYNS